MITVTDRQGQRLVETIVEVLVRDTSREETVLFRDATVVELPSASLDTLYRVATGFPRHRLGLTDWYAVRLEAPHIPRAAIRNRSGS